jgi:hypothetical protein
MAEKDRLFTEEELEAFSKDFLGLAIDALEAGDKDKAVYWMRKQDVNKDAIHDLYVNWITGLLSHIYDNYGEDNAVRAVRETACYGQSGWALPILKVKEQIIAEKGLKGFIEWVIDLYREHAMHPGFAVEEDDEKVILILKQCGSGGRLIDAGAYSDAPFGYRKLKKAGPHTWGEENLPIYCSHCAVVHEIAPLFYGGEGAQFWVQASPFPKNPGDPCIYHIYKDPKNIPDKYYERIQMSRGGVTLAPSYGIDPVENKASEWID